MKYVAAIVSECRFCPWHRSLLTGDGCAHPEWNQGMQETTGLHNALFPDDFRCPLPDSDQIAADLLPHLAAQLPTAPFDVKNAFGQNANIDQLTDAVFAKLNTPEFVRIAANEVVRQLGGIVAAAKFNGLRAWIDDQRAQIPPAGTGGMFATSDDARRDALDEVSALLEEYAPEMPPEEEIPDPTDDDAPSEEVGDHPIIIDPFDIPVNDPVNDPFDADDDVPF